MLPYSCGCKSIHHGKDIPLARERGQVFYIVRLNRTFEIHIGEDFTNFLIKQAWLVTYLVSQPFCSLRGKLTPYRFCPFLDPPYHGLPVRQLVMCAPLRDHLPVAPKFSSQWYFSIPPFAFIGEQAVFDQNQGSGKAGLAPTGQ